MAFRKELHQASWRGVPFGVFGGEIKFGRRNAVHEYPKRGEVWVEDLGRSARKIAISAFLVEDDLKFGGGSVIEQRDRLIAACEKEGADKLVHPTLGEMTVSLMEATSGEQWDKGRVFEIRLTFIESGKRIFPSEVVSTQDAVNAAADAADAAASLDFSAGAAGLLQNGAAVVSQAMSTVGSVVGQVQSLAANATSAIHMVTSLPIGLPSSLAGSLGRYAGGALSGFMPNNVKNTVSPAATVQSLISLGVAARANVGAAASELTTVTASLSIKS